MATADKDTATTDGAADHDADDRGVDHDTDDEAVDQDDGAAADDVDGEAVNGTDDVFDNEDTGTDDGTGGDHIGTDAGDDHQTSGDGGALDENPVDDSSHAADGAVVVGAERDADRAPKPDPALVERNRDGGAPQAEIAKTVQPVTEAVTLRTAAAAVEVDPVLVAAATSTKVTWGSMIVDWMYSIGIRSKKMGTDWLDIPVSKATAARWLVRRSVIYRNVVIPQPGNPANPKLLWETNFSSMDEALRYWGLQTGRWGQSAGENQYYTDGDNVYIDAAGNLVIEAHREAAPDRLGAPNNYTSARVVTMGKQSIGVGTRVVARIQMPGTLGVLPAFWSVGLEPGHEYDWPRQGEIDIVEIPGMGTPDSRTTWTGNIHGPAKTDNNLDVKLHGVDAELGVDLSQGFHDYGMDWHPDRIVWHVDGVEVGRITKIQYEALGGDWTPFSGAWEHYLILNVAVGNPWTGDPDPNAPFHAQMKVDWVKAYAL
ncbi:glycoside hydrolase family 16 protein [Mycobacterium sp. ZZG]